MNNCLIMIRRLQAWGRLFFAKIRRIISYTRLICKQRRFPRNIFVAVSKSSV